jgi:SNF2 family DNA or RNA helicase
MSNWKTFITGPITSSRKQSAYNKLQILMKGLTLRRTKDDMIDGKPLLSLPPRLDEVRKLTLNAKERELYDKVHQKGKNYFESQRQKGTALKNYMVILKAILLMRQACLHSSLVCLDDVPAVDEEVVNDLISLTSNQANAIFDLLLQTEQNICVFCNNFTDCVGAGLTPCKHL